MWCWNFFISAYSFRFRWCVREWLGVYFDWGSDAASLHYSDHSHKPFPHSNGTFWYIDTPDRFHTACQSVVVQCSSIQFQCVQIATAVKPTLTLQRTNLYIMTAVESTEWTTITTEHIISAKNIIKRGSRHTKHGIADALAWCDLASPCRLQSKKCWRILTNLRLKGQPNLENIFWLVIPMSF